METILSPNNSKITGFSPGDPFRELTKERCMKSGFLTPNNCIGYRQQTRQYTESNCTTRINTGLCDTCLDKIRLGTNEAKMKLVELHIKILLPKSNYVGNLFKKEKSINGIPEGTCSKEIFNPFACSYYFTMLSIKGKILLALCKQSHQSLVARIRQT